MLKKTDLWKDQVQAMEFLYERDSALLFADVGTGKTVIALSVMQAWLRQGVADRILVVAPLRVCNDVWIQECCAWNHLQPIHRQIATVAGKPVSIREIILSDPFAKIVLVNYENLPWLLKTYPNGIPGFNVLWFDEIDKMKAYNSLRFKGSGRKGTKKFIPGVKHWREHFDIVMGMTGTPVSNGLLDLWAQVCCIDGGQRLGSYYTHYKRKFFYQNDYLGYSWAPFPDSLEDINKSISDITFRLESKRELGVVYNRPRYVTLPDEVRKYYNSMERNYIMEYSQPTGDDGEIIALNAAAAYGKLRQLTAGFVYGHKDNDPENERLTNAIHDEKYSELDSLISELSGKQLMIVYQYKGQLARLSESGMVKSCVGLVTG